MSNTLKSGSSEPTQYKFSFIFSDFNDSQTTTNEAKNNSSSKKSSSSKSDAKQSGMDINAIQKGDFSSIAGTWKNGRGDTLTFDNNGLVSDKEKVATDQPIYDPCFCLIGHLRYHLMR
ncbi:MAG: DUF6287 domain-containing protein [Clostridioides difficile]|nr:DUF6287 domain-containing protein [Clostridioides difficile]